MILKRPTLLRWTNYMEDCVKHLETSPEAVPSDRILCHHIRLAHLCEEVGAQFSMDDPLAKVSISDPKIGYAIKMFECQLKEWSAKTPEGEDAGESPVHRLLNMKRPIIYIYWFETFC